MEGPNGVGKVSGLAGRWEGMGRVTVRCGYMMVAVTPTSISQKEQYKYLCEMRLRQGEAEPGRVREKSR